MDPRICQNADASPANGASNLGQHLTRFRCRISMGHNSLESDVVSRAAERSACGSWAKSRDFGAMALRETPGRGEYLLTSDVAAFFLCGALPEEPAS